jgi:ATP-binding cassette subfamily F protein 3
LSLVRLADVTRFYGAQRVFGPVNAAVEAGELIGLIGCNGVGKTSLLRLIAELDTPDEGSVIRANNVQIGYMEQTYRTDVDKSLWQYTMVAQEHLTELATRISYLEAQIAKRSGADDIAILMDEYARAQIRFELAGGYSSEAVARATLFGLGFNEQQLQQQFSTLSGGQKSRAALARLLLSAPDLLLLDEPTNHLDMQALEWLENYLQNYKGTCLVVSHDRAFLDKICRCIWELEEGRLYIYPGNYTKARELRAKQRARWLAEYQAQQEQTAALTAYVKRYQAGNRATMAKSRQKALDRMTRIQPLPTESREIKIKLASGIRSGREVVALEDVTVAFGSNSVLKQVQALVSRGDRVGVTGVNGSGKSTLLKVIAGQLPVNSGCVHRGKDVVIAHFTQELTDLDNDNTLIDEVLSTRHMELLAVRSHLARFLFTGDVVFKKVGMLSGGERNRLALAKLVLTDANLLLLDEPTNHLDIPSREVLEEALAEYTGTLIFVSHDRYFLDKLATRIWHLSDGRVSSYTGNYSQFRSNYQQTTLAAAGNSAKSSRVQRRQAADIEKAAARAYRQAVANLTLIEEEIMRTEAEKQRLETLLADSNLYEDNEAAKETVIAHRDIQSDLERLYAQWEKVATNISAPDGASEG